VMKDTNLQTPIIFILSTGADPTGMLFSYAKTQNYLARLQIISLGQGQGPRAQALIDAACLSGDWVLLQNCHLAKSWMPRLELIVDGLGERAEALAAGTAPAGSIHPDFRLFLTSMPADYFPVPVLQTGSKLTNEPPRGLRANLMRSFAQIESWTPFESCDAPGATMDDGSGATVPKLSAWKKLCFGMCFFHSIVQERRKFGPLGFNVKYEFNDSDLETSLLVLKLLLAEQPLIPWDAIRYSSAVLAYGGRVTDGLDLVCVKSIILRYICGDILAEDYRFSPSGMYYAPPVGDVASFGAYAASLPMNDNPEIFGLNLNANIASQRNETAMLLDTVLSIQPRSAGGGGARSPDEIVAELAATIAGELPPPLDMEAAGPTTFVRKGEHMDSLGTVLSQELARFNLLLKAMAGSLFELQRAIRGEVLLSEELDKMFTAMLNNKVPGNWESAAYPSLKPLASWVKDLHARLRFMAQWLAHGQPAAFWISGFFFPQGFLTGALQNHARKYAIAIDTLNFSFRVLRAEGPEGLAPDGSETPGDGVLVYGCFFDGARWDAASQSVTDSRPGEINSVMPIMHFVPTKDYKPNPKEYSAPMYKTSTRAGVLSTTGMSTNYVISCELATTRAPETWTLAGAALLCQLNVR
jgi:dynein heavy chain